MVAARDAYLKVRSILQDADIPDASFDADALFVHVAGASRLFVDFLPSGQEVQLMALARRRAKREPLQYILGSWAFLNLELAVGPGVLVPRPETEEVCLAAVELLKGKHAPTILDLCSGTGALALGLQSEFPTAEITAIELSDAAFDYLERNVAAFGKKPAPHPVKADIFTYYKVVTPQSVDLIIANPPYVTEAEYESAAPEVLAEPREALVAADDGLVFYKAIARDYKNVLKLGGFLVFEIGAGQGAQICNILNRNGYQNVEIRPDSAGHDRIVTAVRK